MGAPLEQLEPVERVAGPPLGAVMQLWSAAPVHPKAEVFERYPLLWAASPVDWTLYINGGSAGVEMASVAKMQPPPDSLSMTLARRGLHAVAAEHVPELTLRMAG